MNESVAEYLVELANDGADLSRIVEDQAESQAEITELYDTIGDFKIEIDSLNAQLKQAVSGHV